MKPQPTDATEDPRLAGLALGLAAIETPASAVEIGNNLSNAITGTSANDILDGRGGNDTINGLGGADLVIGGAGADRLFGGAGNDTLVATSGGADLLDGGEDEDIFVVANTGDTVTVVANSGRDVLDLSRSTAGWVLENTVFQDAVSGNSRIVFQVNFDATGSSLLLNAIIGSEFGDVIGGFGFIDGPIMLGGGNDTLGGTSAGQVDFVRNDIDGGEGIDLLNLSLDSFTDREFDLESGVYIERFPDQFGNEVSNQFSVTNFEDVVGSVGTDILRGTGETNRMNGAAGNDTLEGRGGDDSLYGGADADVIAPGAGDDSANGGAGVDTLSYAALEAPGLEINGISFGVIVDLGRQGIAQNTGEGLDTFENFENLEGSDFNDGLFGDDADNTIDGGDGRDFLTGEDGSDTLFGGADFDVVDGGDGADVLFGGTTGGGAIETDLVAYFGASEALTFVFGTSFSQLRPGTTGTIVDDQIGDDIEGVAGADRFSNTFNAEDIATTTFFLGGSQSDTFFGGSGTDQLLGIAGDDVLYGNDGVDALIGEGGDDDLFGGAGDDFFFFDGVNEGNDTIHDLELDNLATAAIEGDRIAFTGTNVLGLTFADTNADGNGITDTLITVLGAQGAGQSLTILDIDADTVQAQANILI